MIWILCNVVSLTSLVIAGILAMHGKEGWGWFLAATLCLTVFPSSNKGANNETKQSDTIRTA